MVPLDGSREAEAAIAVGEWLARRFGANLHLLTADVQAIERHWYEPYLGTITGDTVPATPHLTDDRDVVEAIRTQAGRLDACLICIATHGRSRSAAVLGSTFAHLVVTGEDPLVAVGPRLTLGRGPDPRRIVACLDLGSPPALTERLIDRTAMWARALGHRLTLATVAQQHDRETSEACVRRLAADPGIDDLDVDSLVLDGRGGPHTALVHHLADHPASFLATATHSRTGAALALLGSETARIIHHSPVPVLVIPPAPLPMG
jgi:nucleotide-binding universal stress UspA family protein